MIDAVRKERTPHLGHMNDMQHGKRMLLLNDIQCGKRMLLLFNLEMANNKFFLDLNPSGWLMMPTKYNIGRDHIQEVEEGYKLLSPLAFYAAKVLDLPPKLEVLPYSSQLVEKAAIEHELLQIQ